MTPDRTAAAIQARHRATEQKLQQVRDAVASLRRHKAPVTYPAVARQAGVSRTFLYANPDARTLVNDAISKTGTRHTRGSDDQEPSWRERALNAEAALKAAQAEIAAQRRRMAILAGPDPRPGTRPVTGGSATAGHREHHAQAARPPAHPRQPDPGRTAGSRPLQQPLRRPAHRPARSPAHRASPAALNLPASSYPAWRHLRQVDGRVDDPVVAPQNTTGEGHVPLTGEPEAKGAADAV